MSMSLGGRIDTPTDTVEFQHAGFSAPLKKGPSGHYDLVLLSRYPTVRVPPARSEEVQVLVAGVAEVRWETEPQTEPPIGSGFW